MSYVYLFHSSPKSIIHKIDNRRIKYSLRCNKKPPKNVYEFIFTPFIQNYTMRILFISFFYLLLGQNLFAQDILHSIQKGLNNPLEVRVLDLKGQGLNALPSEIAAFKNLEILILTNNNLVSLPPEIGKCSNLRELIADDNQLKDLPKEINELTALEFLNLDYNELQTLPTRMEGLLSLEKIRLNNNNFSIFPASLFDCTKLELLEMAANSIKSIPSDIKKLSKLRGADIRYNYIPKKKQKELEEIMPKVRWIFKDGAAH